MELLMVTNIVAAISMLKNSPSCLAALRKNARIIAENFFSHQMASSRWREALLDIAQSHCEPEDNQAPMISSQKADTHPEYSSQIPSPSRKPILAGSKRKPTLSIVTLTKNIGNEFHRTALSIASQNGIDYEWCIIDGASENKTSVDVLNLYAKQAHLFVSEPDGGIYEAMTKSAELATGDFVLYLGSGDYLAHDNVVSEFCDIISNRDIDIFVGNVFEHTANGSVVASTSINPIERIAKWVQGDPKIHPLAGMPPHQGTIIKRHLIKEYGFSSDFRVCADWDQIFRICADIDTSRVYHTNQIIAHYPNGGFSAHNILLWAEEAARISRRYISATDSQTNERVCEFIAAQAKAMIERRSCSEGAYNAIKTLTNMRG